MGDARAIASRFVALSGSAHIGFKLGYTSAAMRAQMGISEPNYGILTKAMASGTLDWSRLVHPRVEPEIALVTAKPISGRNDVSPSAIASVHAAFEIVDTRYTEYRFTLIDNTADNSSAAGFVLGPPHPAALLETKPLSVAFDLGGGEILHGSAEAALGGPMQALAWLANTLADEGRSIPAGSIILTGGLTSAPALERGAELHANFGPLGDIVVSRPA